MSAKEKFKNFKSFVSSVSKNQKVVLEYQRMSWFKLKALSRVLLIPQRGKLDEVVAGMQERLQFDDEHKPKFKRYLELFIEHLTGKTKEIEAVDPDQQGILAAVDVPYEDRIKQFMAHEARGLDG